MTLAEDEDLVRIEEAILGANLPPSPGVLTAYLLLTEWVSSDGETYLVESCPDSQAYWRTLGLLEGARMSIDHRVQATEEAEDDGQ